MTAALPDGWDAAPIGSVARVVGGGTPPSHDPDNFALVGHGIPWVTPADLSGYRSQSVSRGARDLSEAGLARCGATLMPKGTVLFSSRAPIGYVAIAANEISTNQGFKSFVLPAEIDPRFVYWQLKHLKPEADAIATGTTFKELSGAAAATLPLRIAPAPEQTRIADQLDSLLARIQACQDRLQAIPALLKRFRQVVWNAAAAGALTEDWRAEKGATMDWSSCTLADAIDEMRNGLSAKPAEHPPGKRILRIGAVRPGFLDQTDYRFLDVTEHEAASYALREGDLLFTRYNGTLEFVGACAMVDRDLQDYVYPDKLIRVRVNRSLVAPEYLAIAAGARFAREQIENFVKSSAGQKGISGSDLKSIDLRLPDIAEQGEIVRRVRSLMRLVGRIEVQHANATTLVRRLAPITLAKAFRGELVPQDPQDEPASALLARIATQRNVPTDTASAPTPRRGRPPRAPKESAAMTKSRQDHDVMGQPYLAGHLRRIGAPASAEALFKVAELPVADFYKQLVWEVAQGHVKDNQTTLEPGHAAG